MQTMIRLLPEDLGLHCLPFNLQVLGQISLYTSLFKFYGGYSKYIYFISFFFFWGGGGGVKNENFNICKISFNKRYLLHTYVCYTPIATAHKRNELTLAPPCTELTLNSTIKRMREHD